jgi:hypothetical protein
MSSQHARRLPGHNSAREDAVGVDCQVREVLTESVRVAIPLLLDLGAFH